VAIARAAAALGVPYTLSSSATASIERIAREAAPARLWMQVYVLRDAAWFERMLARALDCGCEALMITVDLPVGGKRERDLHNDFTIPFRFTARNLLDFARHPGWTLRMLRAGIPTMENLADLGAGQSDATQATGVRGASAIASSVGRNHDAGFDWARLETLRARWPRKLIVKGVAHPHDAVRLATLGVDAVVVSNHGGRQLDGGAATLDLLPEVVQAVAGRVPVLLDGGVRRGADVLKARALGAQSVLVGRATLYGALAAGEPGARRALDILRDEIERSLRLCGLPGVDAIGPELLMPRRS
jgi:(S)-mandelate dehydrogenase